MKDYTYLIIGGGMTADSAIAGIRELDATGRIGLISAEPDGPYDRPPLSKGLWKEQPLEAVARHTDKKNAALHLGRTVLQIDVGRRQVLDDAGEVYHYSKLLLATGVRPRRLNSASERVIYYRTLADYHRLRAATGPKRRFAVIGAGFIGSEIAAALTMNGQQVVMVFPGHGIGGSIFPAGLADHVTEHYRRKGVEVLPRTRVSGIDERGSQLVVRTDSVGEILVDGVVAGVGAEPNVELARTIGLGLDDGIVVDEFLRSTHPDIYAAGDVAAFPSPFLHRRLRVEHEDNANTMGRLAGRNMAGANEPYHHLPFFYSDLFEFGYEAVGDLDPHLETVANWTRSNEEGVVYYLDQGRVRGVLLWNQFGQVDAARELIAAQRPFSTEELMHRIPVATPTSTPSG
ncbi:NAD(P)/FAD-dependent oxidoreductase [Opitutus terrae]|uniref:FAD-dependent pyridine nucleotide-disulphide oxidoreductase n=1 Tax=Opitutus terrae (strain DSM 11246 / JCM 15787 / PB90-1) TaxID=452637 RepID=B1ZNQ5_OPITP|nr:FAD-dependent oxidoreductase [Opitutus terrae]ACB75425.1 FAD-dependent pyridine nucleotide-disulphide oxidoreductase [Opitutus terrae PB90-1]